MRNLFRIPILTRRRVRLAFVVAIATDALQLMTGPFGFLVFDQFLDVIAMLLTSSLLGFHLLLLPTFVLEFFPVIGWMPTWTGCVALLISMRKREQSASVRAAAEISHPENSNL